MACIAVVNFIRFRKKNGDFLGFDFQNFFVGKDKTYSGTTYTFAPFAFNSNSSTRGGERSDCALVLPHNELSLGIAEEMSRDNRLLEVVNVQLNSDFSYANAINTELWRVAGYEADVEKVVIRLQTPLDAVAAQVPTRVITEELVGALPFESNV